MRVSYETLHRHSSNALETASERLLDLQRQVSTGKRIDRASQDPGAAAAAIVERGRLASTDSYVAAGSSAQSRLMVTDTVLSDLGQQLSAAQVALTAARGTTVTASQREAHARELETLRDAILRDMNTTFDGAYVFAGAASTTAPYAKGNNNVVSGYQGSGQEVSIEVDSGMPVTIGMNGEAIVQGTDPDDLFVEIDRAMTAIRAGDADGLNTGAAALQRAFDRVSVAQSRVGASLQQIDDAQVRLGQASRSTTNRLTALEQVNMAAAITSLAQADTVYRAALGAAGQMNRPSLMDYLR